MSVGWKGKGDVDETAARMLPRIAKEYFQAGEAVLAGGKSPEELHAFRLRTKHFRYTLELFEARYGRRFGALLKRLKPVQEALGDINDVATALAWLRPDESPAATEFLQKRIVSKRKRFEQYWKTVFDKDGERIRWATVLAKPSPAAVASGSAGETGSRDSQ
jgi:CHAD domain-containing protein